jgi:hypothetical protein
MRYKREGSTQRDLSLDIQVKGGMPNRHEQSQLEEAITMQLRTTCWIRKEQLGHEVGARLYLSKEEGKIIVEPLYINEDGIYYPQETTLVLPYNCPLEDLGFRADEALVVFDRRERDMRAYKMTDWPAVKASKLGSVKRFVAKYVAVGLATRGASLWAECRPRGSDDISVAVFLPGAPQNKRQAREWGKRLIHLHECAELITERFYKDVQLPQNARWPIGLGGP